VGTGGWHWWAQVVALVGTGGWHCWAHVGGTSGHRVGGTAEWHRWVHCWGTQWGHCWAQWAQLAGVTAGHRSSGH
ncbi:unnamed protein product, partial [Staurois parvus]